MHYPCQKQPKKGTNSRGYQWQDWTHGFWFGNFCSSAEFDHSRVCRPENIRRKISRIPRARRVPAITGGQLGAPPEIPRTSRHYDTEGLKGSHNRGSIMLRGVQKVDFFPARLEGASENSKAGLSIVRRRGPTDYNIKVNTNILLIKNIKLHNI